MAEKIKDLVWGLPWYMYMVLGIAAAILIVAFLTPPAWEISASVLYGAAELIGGGWLYFVTVNIPTFVKAGAQIRASHGDTKIEIGSATKVEEDQ